MKVLWRLLACCIEGARVPLTIKHSTVREESELVTQAEIIEWESARVRVSLWASERVTDDVSDLGSEWERRRASEWVSERLEGGGVCFGSSCRGGGRLLMPWINFSLFLPVKISLERGEILLRGGAGPGCEERGFPELSFTNDSADLPVLLLYTHVLRPH